MRFKITIFWMIFFGVMQINAMEQEQFTNETENHWSKLPDEVSLLVISFAAKCGKAGDTIKCLAELRMVDKKFLTFANDMALIKMLLLSHLHSEDYQEVLNKMLFKASRLGNINIIEILEGLPAVGISKSIEAITSIEVASDEESDEEGGESGEISSRNISFIRANINKAGFFGYTPLMCAAEYGHKKLVKLFLSYGASVVVTNEDNDTPLILAVKKGHIEIIKHLLRYDAVIKTIDKKGFGSNTAFLWAAKKCIALQQDVEDRYLGILELLAEHGADINASDSADLTAMDWAAKEGRARLINALLDLKTHLTERNKARFVVYLSGVPFNEENAKLLKRIKALEESSVKISDVQLQLRNEPCWLSFKIGEIVYKTEIENEAINLDFIKKISTLEDSICIRIGDAIVDKVHISGARPNSIVKNSSSDSNDYRLAFMLIFGEILFELFISARENKDLVTMSKIKELVIPVFKAYPEKNTSIYGNALETYHIRD